MRTNLGARFPGQKPRPVSKTDQLCGPRKSELISPGFSLLQYKIKQGYKNTHYKTLVTQ